MIICCSHLLSSKFTVSQSQFCVLIFGLLAALLAVRSMPVWKRWLKIHSLHLCYYQDLGFMYYDIHQKNKKITYLSNLSHSWRLLHVYSD